MGSPKTTAKLKQRESKQYFGWPDQPSSGFQMLLFRKGIAVLLMVTTPPFKKAKKIQLRQLQSAEKSKAIHRRIPVKRKGTGAAKAIKAKGLVKNTVKCY